MDPEGREAEPYRQGLLNREFVHEVSEDSGGADFAVRAKGHLPWTRDREAAGVLEDCQGCISRVANLPTRSLNLSEARCKAPLDCARPRVSVQSQSRFDITFQDRRSKRILRINHIPNAHPPSLR